MTWHECPTSGLQRIAVPGGWIYAMDWQYDLPGTLESRYGVSHAFVPKHEESSGPDARVGASAAASPGGSSTTCPRCRDRWALFIQTPGGGTATIPCPDCSGEEADPHFHGSDRNPIEDGHP